MVVVVVGRWRWLVLGGVVRVVWRGVALCCAGWQFVPLYVALCGDAWHCPRLFGVVVGLWCRVLCLDLVR